MDWLASSSGCRLAGMATSRTPRRPSTIAVLAAARDAAARAGSSTRPSRRTSSSRRRPAWSGSIPAGRGRRRVPDARRFPARRCHRGRRDRRDDRHDSVDPVPELARVARRRASGSTSMRPTRARRRSARSFAGASTAVDRADSIVVNPHKWLFTPMDCSTLWTRRPEAFHEAFALRRDYMESTDSAVDLKDYGPALGRRFRALKLWLVLRMYGAEGLRALIREHVRLAQLFASLGRGRAGLGGHRAASVLDRVLPPRRLGQRRDRAARQRDREAVRLDSGTGRPDGDPAGDRERQTTEDDVRLAWEVLCASVP